MAAGRGTVPGVVGWLWLFCLFTLVCFRGRVQADCECGYAAGDVGSGSGSNTNITAQRHVFTEVLESNFALLQDVALDTDWARQAFNVTAERARGRHGEMFATDNVATHPGPEDGLQLSVRSQLVDGMVSGAEVDSTRLDLSYGTFRALMKMSSIPGTCAAFFWYLNDTQEIDIELLSREFDAANASYPVNLVLQSREAAESGFNAAQTGTFVKAYLPFDPTKDFHEYRIDYVPGQVFFYADGALLAGMNGSAVPTSAGHLILQHWSNGNALWSGGPPDRDAVLTVGYVKAYFNSSTARRREDWMRRCGGGGGGGDSANAVCDIPSVSPANSSARGWFFSDRGNMTNNQTVYDQDSGSAPRRVMGMDAACFCMFVWARMEIMERRCNDEKEERLNVMVLFPKR
ncbi:concanavalin A-like lectin/glucanase domain-containing protein [Cercophora scortea]|uniref:Concanavalin A-like lectin/glucanase domain-containing protein n=1 Tax=Cercophora scortea TaxID=314031 RepID=A0AAE0MJ11_9PEZI|nr:concanavalin A-like lectin/glucanase domain-containing protein [Cercophora scortea]